MPRRNIFVLGLDGFHRKLLETVHDADRYNFVDLLDPADIVNPVDCRIAEILPAARRVLDGFVGSVDAIIGHWDFPTSTILPILRRHCGLPGPDLETVLRCEHKYWSRLEQEKAVPGHVPRFAAFDPFAERPRDRIGLAYPFWIKPIKAHSSFLGFHIRDEADFSHALAEIRARIGCVASPFNEILDHASLPPEIAAVDGHHCIAEEIVSAGVQCTLEGYSLAGRTIVYGAVDSARAGRHGSSFVHYGYPSALPEEVQARMRALTVRLMDAIGYDRSPFNVEFFYQAETDEIFVVEINSRISKSHCPLFLLVDGVSHHQVAIKVALGEDPLFPSRQGAFPYAAKFMMRHLGADAFVRHVPGPRELRRLRERFPELLIKMHVREGLRLSDLPFQESYSYELADIFLGGDDNDQVEDRYERCRAMVPIEIEPVPAHSAQRVGGLR